MSFVISREFPIHRQWMLLIHTTSSATDSIVCILYSTVAVGWPLGIMATTRHQRTQRIFDLSVFQFLNFFLFVNRVQTLWQRIDSEIKLPTLVDSARLCRWRKEKINNFTIGDILSNTNMLASTPDSAATPMSRTLAFTIPFLSTPAIPTFSNWWNDTVRCTHTTRRHRNEKNISRAISQMNSVINYVITVRRRSSFACAERQFRIRKCVAQFP